MILLVTCDVAWVGCFLRSSWLSWRFVPLSVNIPEEHLVSKWIRSFWGPIYGASDDFWACFFPQERGNLHISSYIPKSAISVYFNGTHENTSRSSSTSFQDLGLPHEKSSIAAEISRRSSRAKTPGVGNRPRLKGEGDGVASEKWQGQHGALFGWFQHALGMVYFMV